MKVGWVVVCLRNNDVYDCLLDGQIYSTKELADTSIELAKEEDKKQGWNYKYKITEVWSEG